MRLDTLPGSDTIRGIGSSDIQRIYKQQWHPLWLEKTGRAKPEDLTWKLPVQIGRALEPVILDFYGHQTERSVIRGQEMEYWVLRRCQLQPDGRFTFRHAAIDWAVATPDAVSTFECTSNRLVEAKTTNYWNATKETPRFIRSYQSQVQWQMEVCGYSEVDFVFPVDNNRLEVHTIEYDEQFAMDLLGLAETFWHHVINDIEPSEGKVNVPPPPSVRTVNTKIYTMDDSNAWGVAAGQWLDNRDAATVFGAAIDTLKELTPADASKAQGHGVCASRDRAGRVTIRPLTDE